jgi:hypothetical protein
MIALLAMRDFHTLHSRLRPNPYVIHQRRIHCIVQTVGFPHSSLRLSSCRISQHQQDEARC